MTLTVEQQRTHARKEFDVYLGMCPAHQLLESITSKWTPLVVFSLGEGSRRHTELRRQIPGISQKMLTATLRTLERDGLVVRRSTPSVPPRVDYSLSPLGLSLLPVLYGIKTWAEAHMGEVLEHRTLADLAAETDA